MLSFEIYMFFLGKQGCRCICSRCLYSYTNQDFFILYTQKRVPQEVTLKRLRSESHLFWKDHFHKNPIFFCD